MEKYTADEIKTPIGRAKGHVGKIIESAQQAGDRIRTTRDDAYTRSFESIARRLSGEAVRLVDDILRTALEGLQHLEEAETAASGIKDSDDPTMLATRCGAVAEPADHAHRCFSGCWSMLYRLRDEIGQALRGGRPEQILAALSEATSASNEANTEATRAAVRAAVMAGTAAQMGYE